MWYYKTYSTMINKLKEKLRDAFISSPSAVVLVLFTLTLVALNFTPDTYLTGWDTLHPEFDLWLNLKRVLFGVWREEQGLGALAVHSHMSELPRIIFHSVLSIFTPESFHRYLYFFLTLVLGPLG